MEILVTGKGEFTGDDLPIGKYFQVEETVKGTDLQRKTFFALCREYWVSGCHSYNAKSFEHFYQLIKLYICAGPEQYYCYVDDEGKPLKTPVIKYRVKSLRDYTKKERQNAISNLINEMIQVGCNSKKFNEILNTLEKNREASA